MEQNEFDDELFLSVKRLDHAIQLKTFDGVLVTFDWYYGMTTVQLANNYHGHSSGLLGSNDNEHFNDLDLPNGDRNEDLSVFFDAYKVPPKSFFETCTDDNKCNVVASYVAACKIVGIDLVMPNDCLSCEQPVLRKKRHTYRSKQHGDHHGQKMAGGETKELEVSATSAAKQADVIFVVSESAGQGYVAGSLAEFASDLSQKLNAGGIRDVKFGVVGFGGRGVHHAAHFHTGDHELLVSASGLDKAINELNFASPFGDASASDALSAVHFVSKTFPFRAVSTKTIVLFKGDEDCGPNVDYYDVQTELLHRGIQLNVLTVDGIQVDAPHDSELMGFDATIMYTTGGDSSELREALATPHDACTVLAQETGGSVWTTFDREATIFTVPANKIGETVAATLRGGKCFECECDSVNLAPRTVCYPCEVPTPVSLSDKSFFNVPYIQLRNTLRKATKAVGVPDVL